MEEFFVISRQNLDMSWNLNDLRDDNNAFDYCEQILDIPEENIIDSTMGSEGLEVTVIDADYDEDWYMLLRRKSNYAQAS